MPPISRCAISASRTLLLGSGKFDSYLSSGNILLRRSYSKMLQGCVLKNAFVKNETPSIGAWQTLPGQNVSRILARADVDWVMVDCEHGNIDGMTPFLTGEDD